MYVNKKTKGFKVWWNYTKSVSFWCFTENEDTVIKILCDVHSDIILNISKADKIH